jgi:hypothetical protein
MLLLPLPLDEQGSAGHPPSPARQQKTRDSTLRIQIGALKKGELKLARVAKH